MGIFARSKPTTRFQRLEIRKLADTSGTRIVRYDSDTGEKRLVNPDTPGDVHEPWPLAGIEFIGDPPVRTSAAQDWILEGQREGWITLENPRGVARHAGPADLPWARMHNFVHADTVTFETVTGPVKYVVTRQPDKYALEDGALDRDKKVTDEIYEAGETEVSWVFQLDLIEDGRS